MTKDEVAKQYLEPGQYNIWRRVQLKKANEFPIIAQDLGVSKQAVHASWKVIRGKVDRLFNKQKSNEKI